MTPAHGAERNRCIVTEHTRAERFCRHCDRWVLCKGILGFICCPECTASWSEPRVEHIVMCEVSQGVTGLRQSPLKRHGVVCTYPTFDAAALAAAGLERQMNGPSATALFRYWAVTRPVGGGR